MERELFDQKLARECAKAFSASTGLGCTLSDRDGNYLAEYGHGCESCGICSVARLPRNRRIYAHNYGMAEAQRFGGKYIYFCPMGLTCFVSPIVGDGRAEAKITAGPFIMVEKRDFISCELEGNPHLSQTQRQQISQLLDQIPYVPTARVNHLSVLLFMAVGFMNDVSEANRRMEADRSEEIQGQISSYILELKEDNQSKPYPIDKEQSLLQYVAQHDRANASRMLNELLGAILFAAGGNIAQIKSRLYELLVLISRTAIQKGADPERTLRQCHEYRIKIGEFTTIDGLCLWLSEAMGHYMDDLLQFSDAKHANIIHRCIQYISTEYRSRITLEDAAKTVYLSPAYLSRIFRQETGLTFNEYLNTVRINKAKDLLRMRELRITDVALSVGYGDQSYFTKVFKRITGLLPRQYRESVLVDPKT